MMDDASLLQRWTTAQDASAFAELARRHAGLIYGASRRIVRDHQVAEEVAQECLLELARRAASIRDSVVGFLYATAVSRARNRLRDEAARRRHEAEAGAAQGTDQGIDHGSEPTWAELSPLLDDALAELPEDLRLPLVLHFLEGRSQPEVARALNCGQATVSRRIALGIETLRQRLGKRCAGISVAVLALMMQANAVEAASPALLASAGKIPLSVTTGFGAAAGGSAIATSMFTKVAVAILAMAAAGAATLIGYRLGSTPPKSPTMRPEEASPPAAVAPAMRPVESSSPSAAATPRRAVVWTRDFSAPFAGDTYHGRLTSDGCVASIAPESDMLRGDWRPDQVLLLARAWVAGKSQPLFTVPVGIRVSLRVRSERAGRISVSLAYADQLVRDEAAEIADIAVGPDWQEIDLPMDRWHGSRGGRGLDAGIDIGSIAIWGFEGGIVTLDEITITGTEPDR